MTNTNLQQALEAWGEILSNPVIEHPYAQARYGPCTISTSHNIPAAIAPLSDEEVMECVKIANQFRIPLYPISTGNNWGYGSANPTCDNCVIVDLSQMNKILELDPELGVVTLQPGVTQQQLYEYLSRNKLPYMVPVTGAGPSCSLLGNALERGYGITPHSDHFSAVTHLEAVLADGSLYRPSLTELGGNEVDKLYKWGMGPYLDGLFTQANLGIVTRMSIVLARKPESVQAFFFSIKNDQLLERAIIAIREILQETAGLTGSINLMNTHRMLAMVAPYPKQQDKSTETLAPETIASEARKFNITAWTGVGAIYGNPAVVKAARKIIKGILRPYTSRLSFVSATKLKRAKFFITSIPGMRGSMFAGLVDKLEQTLNIMEGKPSEIALQLAYWRSGNQHSLHKNPALDGCGLIWYSPLVPMKPDRVRCFTRMASEICQSHGIEPLITLTSLSDRCFDSTIPILYDKLDPDAAKRAEKCYFTLYERCGKEGFLPYRLGVHSMYLMNEESHTYSKIINRIKYALDPNYCLAPGRYSSNNDLNRHL